jgi:hypothetical protein
MSASTWVPLITADRLAAWQREDRLRWQADRRKN